MPIGVDLGQYVVRHFLNVAVYGCCIYPVLLMEHLRCICEICAKVLIFIDKLCVERKFVL